MKYTYADVIIDPNDPRVEIGANYWFSNKPSECLKEANQGKETLLLTSINNAYGCPFTSGLVDFTCIIRKKEPKKKYVPFDFNDPEVRRELIGKTIIHNCFDGDDEFKEIMIVGFMNKGDEDRDCWSSNGYTEGTIAMTIDGFFHDDELLKECTFIDGTPCGRLVEDK